MEEAKPVRLIAVDVPLIYVEEVIVSSEEDKLLRPVVKDLKEDWPEDEVKKKKLEMLLRSLRHAEKELMFQGKLCIPRKYL